MLKKIAFLFVAIVLCSHLQGTGKDFTTSTWPDCNEVETMQGGYINYEGTIGLLFCLTLPLIPASTDIQWVTISKSS